MEMSNILSRRLLDTTLLILLKYYNYMLTLPQIVPKAPNAKRLRMQNVLVSFRLKQPVGFFVTGRLLQR